MIWPYMSTEERAVELDQPKRERLAAQRALRAEQAVIRAELDRERSTADPEARRRDARGEYGADRYIRACVARARASRRSPPHRPWARLLEDWIPEKRCANAFAEDAGGAPVLVNDPAACRWCFAGWLASRCVKPSRNLPHRVAVDSWVERFDAKDAKRLLDEMWALLPERVRELVLRRHARAMANTPKADRKRIEHHPLGYWWQLHPTLAARWLGLTP